MVKVSCFGCNRSMVVKELPVGVVGVYCTDCAPEAEPTPQERRQPPPTGEYAEGAINLYHLKTFNGVDGYYPVFNEGIINQGITAEQCREIAHLLNQLAEYLEQ